MMRSAAVVGAGILGRLLALRLRRLGIEVTLFDSTTWEARSACSFAAAGLLTPISESLDQRSGTILTLGLRSRGLWSELLPTLAAPVKFGAQGTLHLAHPQDRALLQEWGAKLARRLPSAGCQTLDAEQLRQLVPALGPTDFKEAIYLPADGYIDAPAALAALRGSIIGEGVVCRMRTEVTSVEPGVVATRDQGSWRYDQVFDCRGLGAASDLPMLRGVRGELIEVHAPEVELTLPIHIMHQRYPIYIVPRSTNCYAIGATSIESESLAPVTVKAALELLTAAYSVHPGFRFAQITNLVANCRPAFPDHLPKIYQQPGLWRLNGLYRCGFLLAPVLVDCTLRRLARAPLGTSEENLFANISAPSAAAHREGAVWIS